MSSTSAVPIEIDFLLIAKLRLNLPLLPYGLLFKCKICLGPTAFIFDHFEMYLTTCICPGLAFFEIKTSTLLLL